MGSRDEYNTLMRELLRHIEQVAILGANIQFKEEIEVDKPIEYLTCCEKTKNYLRNNVQSARYKQIVRFHSAYMKYFVFASDPYAEIVIPLSPSSLSLFIWKHQFTFQHTSKTIIEFLQARTMNYYYLTHHRGRRCVPENSLINFSSLNF